MSKEQVVKEWKDKIDEFKNSGLTQTQWCKQEGVNLRNFNRWFNIFKNQSEPPRLNDKQNWISLKIEGKSANAPLNVKIGKATIEISEDFNPKLLSEVIKVLNGIC